MTTELVKYDAMCRAIAEAYEVDEVKELRNKAIAFETYAKQAKNVEAERQACEIRLRAERRCGQLLKEMEKAKGARGTGSNQYQQVPSNEPRTPTLDDRGISYDQSSQWQKLADISEDEFEARLRGPDKPTTSGLIEAAKPEITPVSTAALRLWGRLHDFERENWLAQDPEEIMATMVPTMRADVVRLAPIVSEWIGRIYAGSGCQQAAE